MSITSHYIRVSYSKMEYSTGAKNIHIGNTICLLDYGNNDKMTCLGINIHEETTTWMELMKQFQDFSMLIFL